MPYSPSGVFTRVMNFVQDKLNGIKVVAARMDDEFDNFSQGMNEVMLRNGVAPMTGNLDMNDHSVLGLALGTVGSPSLRSFNDPTTGVFFPSSGRVAFAVGGVNRLGVGPLGVNAAGSRLTHNSLDVALRDAIINLQSGSGYTLQLTDANNVVMVDVSGDTVGVPANVDIAFPIGTRLQVINDSLGVCTIVEMAGAQLKLGGTGGTGNKSLAIGAVADLLKFKTNIWYVWGPGVS